MKYALFALAALLLLIGGFSVFTGLSVLDTERGWASVISGTTAIVGSGIILGLAFALQTLEQIRGLLQAGVATAAVKAFAPNGLREPDALRDRAAEAPAAPLAWPPHTSPLASIATEAETEAAEAPIEAPVMAEAVVAEAVVHERREVFAAEAEEIARAPMERPVPEPAKPQSSFKDIWRRVGKESDVKPPRLKPAPATPSPPRSAPFEKPAATEPRSPLFGGRPPVSPPASPSPAGEPLTGAPLASQPLSEVPPPPPPPMHQVEFTAEQNDWLDHALAELDSAIAETPFARRAESDLAKGEPTKNELPKTEPMKSAPAAAENDKAATPPFAATPAAPEKTAEKMVAEKPVVEERHAGDLPPPLAQDHLGQDHIGQNHLGQDHLAQDPLAQDHLAQDHRTRDLEPAADLATLAQEPAVIGRYEAEGTTYVMFADGSIEAQSERGVARFKSMADLKAYFETQEAPQ